MTSIENKFNALGLQIRQYTNPTLNFTCGVLSGSLLFISGHTPTVEGVPQYKGIVGNDVDIETAQKAAILCLENCLGAAKTILGSLDHIQKVVKVNGFVASAAGFDGQAQVLNAVSSPLQQVFGEKHARAALGVAGLPGGVPVEVELILEVAERRIEIDATHSY